jgi:phage terminase Nu1 subunit (DNA packaging protein)
MWDAIDGQAGSPELAKIAKVSDRAAQMFVKDLLDAGLVGTVATGRGTVVARDDDAIVQWYLKRPAHEE